MVINIDYDVENGVENKEEQIYLEKYRTEITKVVTDILKQELYCQSKDCNLDILNVRSLINSMYISIEFVSKEDIKTINKEYRDVDKVTDVLSFPMYEVEELKQIKRLIKASMKEYENKNEEDIKPKYLAGNNTYSNITIGDIIICFDKIKEQADEYGHSIGRELMYMIVHAMLHLLGYDHIEEADKKKMRKREEAILRKYGYTVVK